MRICLETKRQGEALGAAKGKTRKSSGEDSRKWKGRLGVCGRLQVKAVACVGRAKTAQTFCTRAMASGRAQKRKRSLQRKRLIRAAQRPSRSRYFLKRAVRSSGEKHSPLI